MGNLFQTFIYVLIGLILLGLGYFLFFGPLFKHGFPRPGNKKKNDTENIGKPGNPQVCPVCSMKMQKGETIKSTAFEASAQNKDRLVHIKGCRSCLERGVPRKCPVCGTKMSLDDYLITRMFERSSRKNHIHVLGCNNCRRG